MITPGQVSVRPYSPADCEAVKAFLKTCVEFLSDLRLGNCNTLIAETDGEIIGIVHLHRNDDAALLRLLAVADHWRGRNIGSTLLRKILSQAHEQYIKDVFLPTIRENGFFEHRGFLPVPWEVIPKALRELAHGQSAEPCSALKITLLNRPLYC